MKNTDFKNKKDILNKSNHIKMNVNILNKEVWNEEEINKRSAKLANEFIKIFPYPEFEITEDEDVYSHINLIMILLLIQMILYLLNRWK